MDALTQRLKELDPDTFHKLCFQLLKERHTPMEITQVAGESGDEGLDVFCGRLAGAPTIWQCKAFGSGVGKSQKAQIRKSLKTALKRFTPKEWILCLAVDMDSKALRWFERLKESYSKKVLIGKMEGQHIVHELIHRRTLRNYYFPNVALDPVELRAIVSKTGELSEEELDSLTDNNLEQYVDRLKQRDSRFNYQITYDGDLGPQKTRSEDGLVFAISDGAKTIKAFARDKEALRRSPLSFSLAFKANDASARMSQFIKKGFPLVLKGSELKSFKTDVPFPTRNLENAELRLSMAESVRERKAPCRLSIKGLETIQYSFIEFSPTRGGTEEVEIQSSDSSLPFSIAFVLPFASEHRVGRVDMRENYPGKDLQAVEKWIRAARMIRGGAEMELHSLQLDKILFRGTFNNGSHDSKERERTEDFFLEAARVAKIFGADLRFPENVTPKDVDSVLLLKRIADAEPIEANDITITLEKSEQNERTMEEFLLQENTLKMVRTHYEPVPEVFGVAIPTGPIAIVVDRARANDPEEVLKNFKAAKFGDGVRISFTPKSPIIFRRAAEEDAA